MKKTTKIILAASLAIATTFTVRCNLNHAIVDEAVSKVMIAEKMLYRRGDYERIISLDATAKGRIIKALLNGHVFHYYFVKSVCFGGVYFIDDSGEELLDVSAFKGNVIRIDRTYIELSDDFLTVCGFSSEAARKVFQSKSGAK